jgi:antitoxin ParD1/3/4
VARRHLGFDVVVQRLLDAAAGLRAAKLEQLRDEIRQGLNSGPSKAWSAEDAKREGRALRTRKAS